VAALAAVALRSARFFSDSDWLRVVARDSQDSSLSRWDRSRWALALRSSRLPAREVHFPRWIRDSVVVLAPSGRSRARSSAR